jgi:hypothetical protein
MMTWQGPEFRLLWWKRSWPQQRYRQPGLFPAASSLARQRRRVELALAAYLLAQQGARWAAHSNFLVGSSSAAPRAQRSLA